jgi:hypothetical protein
MMDQLEQLVDAHGLERVVEALSVVCGDKADHVLIYWQDHALAVAWDRASRRLHSASLAINLLFKGTNNHA